MTGYPDGAPIPDVQILAMDPRGRSVESFTDGAGTFAVEVDSGLFRVRARPDQQTDRIGAYWGDSFGFCPGAAVELGHDEQYDDVLIELPEGGAVEGTALDEHGLPLPGAAVSATGLDFYNSGVVRSGITDDDGRFRIVGVDSVQIDGEPSPGHYRLSVRSDGEATWFLPGTWDQAAADPVETLRGETVTVEPGWRPEPATLTGQVLGADGEALEGAVIELYAAQGGTLLIAPTDAGGVFSFPTVGGTDLELTASAAGHASTALEQPLRPEPGEALELEPIALVAEARLAGQVTGLDPVGGQLSLEDDTGRALTRVTLTGGDTSWLLDGLPEGTWSLRFTPASTSDLQSVVLPGVTLVAGEQASVELDLELGAGLTGVVRRRGGEVLAGVELTALDPDTVEELPRGRTHTDADGRFSLRGLPPGPALVRAAWRPFCSTDPTWVETWLFDARHEAEAEPLDLEGSVQLDLGELLLAPDRDTDAMDDVWELAWGLDRSRDDGGSDLDADGRSNLQEYLDRTDPLELDRTDGCSLPGLASRPRALTLTLTLLAVWLTRRRAGATMPASRTAD